MAEKKATTKAAAEKKTTKAASEKKAAPKRAAKKVEIVGLKAGDVYQALFSAEQALSVKDIAKAAKISEEETLLGMGWLFKEGKIKDEEGLITLA